MKTCSTCNIEKSLDSFRISKRKDKQWHSNICKECTNAQYMDKYYEDHLNRKEKLKHKARYLTYGITGEQFKALLKKQNNCCAICGSKVAGGRGDWHVDHCHTTNKVRGLLCHHCNTGLGLFKDSTELLKLAAEYLDEHK